MIPCAAWHYWRSNDPFYSERVIVHCQWGRKFLPDDRRCGLPQTCRRRTDPRIWATCTKKFVKIARVVPEISCLTDIQTHRHTSSRQTHSSQYLATALAGEVITCLKTLLKRSQGRAIANFDWDVIHCWRCCVTETSSAWLWKLREERAFVLRTNSTSTSITS